MMRWGITFVCSLFFNHHSYCITGADKVLVVHTLSGAAAKS